MIKKLSLFCLLLVFAIGCSSKNNDQSLIPAGDRVAATEIDGNFLNSPALSLAKLKGHPVVLDFWATWCGPCRMELPSFVKMYPELHAKGVEFIGLTVEQPSSQPPGYFQDFAQKFALNYPIAFASEKTARAYGIESIPATFFIDKNGKVAMAFIGVHSEQDLQGVIEKLLAE